MPVIPTLVSDDDAFGDGWVVCTVVQDGIQDVEYLDIVIVLFCVAAHVVSYQVRAW